MTDDSNDSDDDRYGALTIGAGEVVVYDRTNPDAWVQSDQAVQLSTGSTSPR